MPTRAAPVTSVVLGGKAPPIAASAGWSSVRMKGKADSGQMSRLTSARPVCSGLVATIREREIMGDDLVLVRGAEILVLGDIGLHQPDFDAGQVFRRRRGKANGAKAGEGEKGADGDDNAHGQAALAFFEACIGEERRGGENRDRQNIKRGQAADRRELRQHEMIAERHPVIVPGKAGEHVRRAAIR